MEAPPRRREAFSSLQLQRASDQLQEAIKSARSRGRSSRASSLSLLSDGSVSNASDSEAEEDDEDNQENHPHKANTYTTETGGHDKPTPEQKLRRFMAESIGSTGSRHLGASLSLKDLLASPLRPTRDASDGVAALKLQAAGEMESGCSPEREPSENEDVEPTAGKRMGDTTMESQTRQAIEMLQRDVEAQARLNRDTQEQLGQAFHRITVFVEQAVERSFEDCTADQKTPLDPIAIEKLSEKWMEALAKWKQDIRDTISGDCQQRISEIKDEMENQLRVAELTFDRERESLTATISSKVDEANDLRVRLDALQRMSADERARERALVDKLRLDVERLHMQDEDWKMRLPNVSCSDSEDSGLRVDAEELTKLDLLSKLRQSELRELHWEMKFREQAESVHLTEDRLNFRAEDANRSNPVACPQSASVTDSEASDRRASTSWAISSERKLHEQQIEILKGQLEDLKEQIRCDHEQYLYEQQKRDSQNKDRGDMVDEVHVVSVKVLKLLLIREKLLRKQEKKTQKRRDKLDKDEHRLQEIQDAIHILLESALQECGVALLYVRQLAMASSAQQTSATLPVKPIKLVRVIKRLKCLQQDLAIAAPISTQGTDSPATPSSRVTSSDRG